MFSISFFKRDMAFLTIVVFLVPAVLSAQLPSSFLKCDRKQNDFDQCLRRAIQNVVPQLNKPFKEVGLPNLEPLEIPSLVIGAGTGAVSFQQIYNDLKISGFTKIRCSKAEFNFADQKFILEGTSPQIIMDYDYEVNGRLLLLPITGKGPGHIVIDDMKSTLEFDLEEFEKKGRKHFKVVATKVELNPRKIHFKILNLFGGDKILGDNMNQVLNENWQEVFADVKDGYEEAFARIFGSIFNSLLARVSIADLFGEE